MSALHFVAALEAGRRREESVLPVPSDARFPFFVMDGGSLPVIGAAISLGSVTRWKTEYVVDEDGRGTLLYKGRKEQEAERVQKCGVIAEATSRKF